MNIQGIILGLASFLIIGFMHPVVIKGEYCFGTKIWPLFAITGGCLCIASLWITDLLWSAFCAVWGFSWFWGIKELFEQEERVKKGWYPSNPKKKISETRRDGKGRMNKCG